MIKGYPFLLVMSWGLLAGCDREHKQQEVTASGKALGATDSMSRTLPPPMAAPPADSSAAGAVVPEESRRQIAVASPTPRVKWGATVLADASDENLATASVVSALDSTRKGELQRFLLAGLPAAQLFTIRPGRDTMVTGPQGTQLLVSAGIWDLPTADSNAVVKLELQEFYGPADMVLAGLSTTAGPQLLETGGMLHLKATAGGQPVRLRPGRYMHLRMPDKEAKPGMQLFEGIAHGTNKQIDWRLPGRPRMASVKEGRTVNKRQPLKRQVVGPAWHADTLDMIKPMIKWPRDEYFKYDLLTAFKKLDNTGKRRRSPGLAPGQKYALEQLSDAHKERIVRWVKLRFVVDSTGMIQQPVLGTGCDPELGATVLVALSKLPRWQPAELPTAVNGRAAVERAAAQGQVQLAFAKSGRIFFTQQRWSLARASRSRAKHLKQQLDSLLTDRGFRRRYRLGLDSLAAIADATSQAQTQAELTRLRTQFTDTSRSEISAAGVYNELSTKGLGWINCDRYPKAYPMITFKVQSPNDGTITTLVLGSIRGLMCGEQISETNVAFPQSPLGKRATVVSLKRENGITYLATRSTLIGPATLGKPAFRAVTMAELRAELARL